MTAFQTPYSQFFSTINEFQNSFMSNFGDKNVFTASKLEGFSGTSRQFSKNCEAFFKASNATADLAQTLTRHSTEYSSQVVEAFADYIESGANIKSPQDGFEKQTQFAKKISEHTVSSSKVVSDIVTKSGDEVSEIVKVRVSEALNEISDITSKVVNTAGQATGSSDNNGAKKKAA